MYSVMRLTRALAKMLRCAAAVAVGAAATVAVATTPARADALDDYVRLQTGSFTTAQQAKLDARYDTAIWHLGEIWPGREAGVRWMYSESWMKDAKAPYMQRVSRLVATADGSIAATRFAVPQPERVVGAWQEAGKFAGIDPQQLQPLEGCDAVIARTSTQRFEGGTTGSRCRNAYKGSAYAISQSIVDAEGFTNWDRGFSATGSQTWGPAHGGYQFRRVDAPSTCVDPVRMLVYGEVTDRAAFGAYARALGESGLYPRNGGYYEAATPALEVFEGSPPRGRGVIIAQFPCLEAARRFWNSPEYAQIRKLRAGVATFEVLVMPVAQKPKYLAE